MLSIMYGIVERSTVVQSTLLYQRDNKNNERHGVTEESDSSCTLHGRFSRLVLATSGCDQ